MRLKKIPAGTKVIKLTNNNDKEAWLHLNREHYRTMKANSFIILDAPQTRGYPDMQLYANVYVEVECLK